jgi:hypothetical protein
MAAFRANTGGRRAPERQRPMTDPAYDPWCVASTCGFHGTIAFTVREEGCFGGRFRLAGEVVLACAGHAEDITRSQAGATGLALAEWLLEDAHHNPSGQVLRVVPADRS